VGAGPAGSCAAREVAQKGIGVIAIDRRKEIGYPVQCGEFLPTADELRRILPESEEFGDLFSIDGGLVERRTSVIELHGPRGLRYDMQFSGVTLDRRRFDKSLWQSAQKSGAELRTETEFLGLSSPNTAKTTAGDIEFRVLIGADGPLSRVRATVGLPRPKAISQAVTAQAKGDFGSEVKMFFGGLAPGGYAWIIPKNGRANIGLGVQKKFTNEPLSKLMESFLGSHGMTVEETAYGQVPVSGPIGKTVKGNTMIVGDAAGHVMATNGGGIPIAMICGRIAGRCAGNHIAEGTGLDSYEKEWRRQVQAPLRNAARTKWFADFFFGNDDRLRLAMKVLRERGLERAVLCKRLFYVL